MPSDVKPFGVAVIGAGPIGQFIHERLSLREDFVAVQSEAIDHPRTDLVYCAKPVSSEFVATVLLAKKHVVLSSTTGLTSIGLQQLEDIAVSNGLCVVLDERCRWDEDFLCASSAVDGGRLGSLERLRLAIHERSLPGETFPNGVLRDLGCHWLDQLLRFIPAKPNAVRLRRFPDEGSHAKRGFLAVIDFIDGTSAVIELQTGSLLSSRTGWLLEGTDGAYRLGRLYTITADGEIIDEPVSPATPVNDPLFDVLATTLLGEIASRPLLPDLRHMVRVTELMELLEASLDEPYGVVAD